jgi:hypothetical protein
LEGHSKVQCNFNFVANVIGSSLVRRMLKLDRTSK